GAFTLNFSNTNNLLVVNSGGILGGHDSNARAIGTATVRGRLTAGVGQQELFIHNGQNVFTINSRIEDNGAPLNLVLGGLGDPAFPAGSGSAPQITLTGSNIYTGTTYANGIILNLSTTIPGALSIPGDLVISGGASQALLDSLPIGNAIVNLRAPNQIADTATVTIKGGSQLQMNYFDEAIANLVLTNDGGSNGNAGPGIVSAGGTLKVQVAPPLRATTTKDSDQLVFTVAPLVTLVPGTPVSGLGIAPGTTILSGSGTTYTLSAPAAATASGAFDARASINGTTSLVFDIAPSATLPVGTPVSGPGIPVGTTIAGGSGTNYTLSQPATTTATISPTIGGTISAHTLTNANSIPTINGFLDATAGQNFNVAASSVLPGQIGLAINAAMTGTNGITKSGAGVLSIGGQSSLSGPVMVNEGTLAFNAATAFLGNAQIILASGTSLDTRGVSGSTGLVVGSGTITNFNPNTAATLTTGYDNSSGTFSGVITTPFANGLLSIIKIGTGTWNLTGNSSGNLVSSNLTVHQGAVNLSAGSNNSINFRTYTLNSGGSLILDNTSFNVSNRLGGAQFTDMSTSASNRGITLQGGKLVVKGAATGSLVENMGALTVQNGRSIVEITPGGGSSTNNTINFISLANIANNGALGGTLLLRGPGLGGTPGANTANVTFTTALATGTTLIGTVLTADNNTIAIRPDILGDVSLTGNGTGFVVAGANGLRLINPATEQLSNSLGTQPTTAPWAAITPNVNSLISSQVFMEVSATTINSLTISGGNGVLMAAAKLGGLNPSAMNPTGTVFNALGTLQSLTITSGGILSIPAAGPNPAANVISGGVITTGTTNQLIFHTIGDLTVNSYLNATATQGFIKSSDGKLTLNRRSFVGGTATVNGGTLELNSGPNTLLVVPTATVPGVFDLRVNAGTVDLMGNNQAVASLSNNNPLPGSGGTVTNSGSLATFTVIQPNNVTVTFGGTLSGALNFTKSQTAGANISNLILSSPQTYSGSTNVRGGTLTLRDSGALLNTSAINIYHGTLTLDNQGLSNSTSRISTTV
ncbi:MAG: beta strand repeat-containing protein, partial [Roseimicrobium sp.]